MPPRYRHRGYRRMLDVVAADGPRSRWALQIREKQVAESIDLQKQAMGRFRTISRIAIPGILLCIALLVYLVARYL